MSREKNSTKKPELKIGDFIKALLMPLLVGKVAIFYFGLKYSNYPGEGYGYGLICAMAFTVISLSRFIWKYRNYTED